MSADPFWLCRLFGICREPPVHEAQPHWWEDVKEQRFAPDEVENSDYKEATWVDSLPLCMSACNRNTPTAVAVPGLLHPIGSPGGTPPMHTPGRPYSPLSPPISPSHSRYYLQQRGPPMPLTPRAIPTPRSVPTYSPYYRSGQVYYLADKFGNVPPRTYQYYPNTGSPPSGRKQRGRPPMYRQHRQAMYIHRPLPTH